MMSPKPKRRTRRKPAPGSLRVAAWLHSAIWPLREALGRELAFLDQGHLTWTAGSQTLAGFRPARSQLTAASRANLDDLIACHAPELTAAIDEQEAAIAGTITAAAAAQLELLAGPIRDALERARQRKRVDDALLPDLAQEVINRAVGASVRLERAVIDAIRPALDAIPRTGALATVDAAHDRLVTATAGLAAALDLVRDELCDAYDLPPAPIHEPTPHHGHR